MEHFHILSLSGGGARGIFQAQYLKHLAQHDEKPLWRRFDLIAGTSAGAINALHVSLGLDITAGTELFTNIVSPLFKPRPSKRGWRKAVFRGAIYDQSILRNALLETMGTKTLGDCKTLILCTAASVSGYKARIFTNHEGNRRDKALPAVDVALASSAAPTFFDPVELTDISQSFLDGVAGCRKARKYGCGAHAFNDLIPPLFPMTVPVFG